MPYLVVNGVTIPVQLDDGDEEDVIEVGDRGEAFDGTALSSVRSVKSRWRFRTGPVDAATAAAIKAAVLATPPIACSGDVLGAAVSCHGIYRGRRGQTIAGGARRFRLQFELREA